MFQLIFLPTLHMTVTFIRTALLILPFARLLMTEYFGKPPKPRMGRGSSLTTVINNSLPFGNNY